MCLNLGKIQTLKSLIKGFRIHCTPCQKSLKAPKGALQDKRSIL